MRGNIVADNRTIQGQVYALGYAYDTADRLTTLTYPSGLVVTFSHDSQGRVQVITADGQPVLSDIAYLPFGPATSWTDGSGLAHTETFDQDYRSTGIRVGSIQDFGYLYDAADNITDWTDGLDASNSQSFDYDGLDRLLDADGPYGAIDFTYDNVGNRLSEAVGTNQTTYSYESDSHRLQETTGADPGSYDYDAAGNLIQDDRFTYVYNQADRLAEVRQGGDTIASYLYNAEGERVAKTANGATHHFVYGPDGELLGVYDAASGEAREELVYFGSVPVATVRNGAAYYIHRDHLGTPRFVSDQNQTVVWRWLSDPFGEAMPNQDPDGDGTSFALNLHFPGQYFDVETSRHYNYFRDYDPARGRYVQSDPIGLKGGLNTYSYVRNNPLRFVDPFGTNRGSPEWCARQAEKIRNIRNKIQERLGELDENPLDLPEACPGDDLKPSLSRRGHRKLINQDKANLAAQEALYAAYCGGGPPPVPVEEPETQPGTEPEPLLRLFSFPPLTPNPFMQFSCQA